MNSKNKKPIKALIFDIYGTILKQNVGDLEDSIDFKNSIKLLRSFKRIKNKYKNSNNKLDASAEELKNLYLKYINKSHNQSKAKGIKNPEVKIEKIWHSILKDINHRQKNNKNFWFEIADYHQQYIAKRTLYPNIEKVLKYAIDNNLKLGIISNAQFYTITDLINLLKTKKEFKNIKSVFEIFTKDISLFSYKLGFSKPNPKVFKIMKTNLKKYSIDMDETLFIGNDILNDIYCGNKSGMQTCLSLNHELKERKNNKTIKNDKKNYKKPTYTIDNLKNIIDILESQKKIELKKFNKYYSEKELDNVINPLIKDIIKKKGKSSKPFIISIQGGQGTGKTTFAKFISNYLKIKNFKTLHFSIDDYYLTAKDRKALSKKYKNNPYYQIPRGLPGTHDVKILQSTLTKLKNRKPTKILHFEKSLKNGYGDRLKSKTIIKENNIDFIIFEGYCNNMPTTNIKQITTICKKYNIDISFDKNKKFTAKMIKNIKPYQPLWKLIDYNISLRENSKELSIKWRKQQEKQLQKSKHNSMKSKDVKYFVNMFQPITYLCYDISKFDKIIKINKKHDLTY